MDDAADASMLIGGTEYRLFPHINKTLTNLTVTVKCVTLSVEHQTDDSALIRGDLIGLSPPNIKNLLEHLTNF